MPTPQAEVAKPTPKKEEALDDALADSFPASDPISPGAPHRSTRADEDHIAEHVASHDEKADNK
jgi:hypothetical protein